MIGRDLMAHLVLLVAVAAPWSVARAMEATRLDEAVTRFPDDQDLAWAQARELVREERNDEALAALERIVARWPGHFAARFELGTLLSDGRQNAEAVAHLERAVALAPESGPARLLLGVVLEELGRFDEAERQLELAAVVDASLRAESLLLRGIAQFEHGDERLGVQLLEEAIGADQLGDVADAARVLLATASRPSRPRVQVEAYAGLDYDSNVTLDSGSTPAVSSDQADGALVVGAALAADAVQGDDFVLNLGARYHERDYIESVAFDQRTLLGNVSGQWRFGPRFAVRLGGVGSYVMLGEASYLAQAIVRPELLVWLGQRAGVLRISAHVAGDFYFDDPPISSLERDALTFGGALAQLFPVPGLRNAEASWRFGYERIDTRATTDLLGFAGDYDRNAYAFELAGDVELPLSLTVAFSAGVMGEIYDNPNLTDYLSQVVATGAGVRRERSDVSLEAGLCVSRPVHERIDVEISWHYQQRFSNTEIFDYDRNVVGALVRVHAF